MNDWPARTPLVVLEAWDLLTQLDPATALKYVRTMETKLEMKLPYYGRRMRDARPPYQ